ncbi:DnaB-like helicase C-terminal domain-containing protein [Polaribacter sp. BAL334]|uniref:DnaB-like helicase C-terminal domain-containing protein n=1 Tax=Polaribacter sp. BAL334 TaxID=1708178 RepID=UPI0018D22E84|nr:DnaB-like helicase C-terminal domain-containing protein [Polaribacter sp. BAL334]MBG7613178.1 DnaB-like helicase C-terminal domain-containing protein [Polaribacter sp. BAL334]
MKSTYTILRRLKKQTNQNLEGLKTGFLKFDKFTKGFQPGQLILMASRPGMGNLAFAKCLVLNTSIRHQNQVAIFSLEQSAKTYLQKMIATEAGISYVEVQRQNHLEETTQKLNTATAKIAQAPIFINDDPSFTLNELIFKVKQLKSKHTIKLLVIHGCHLVTDNEQHTHSKLQEQDFIGAKLKELAEYENIAIIITQELPDSLKSYANNEGIPTLKEVYEDTPIAKHADLVTFLYRPEYDGLKTWYDTHESCEGEAALIILKNRHGNLNNFKLSFDGYSSRFTEVDDLIFTKKS